MAAGRATDDGRFEPREDETGDRSEYLVGETHNDDFGERQVKRVCRRCGDVVGRSERERCGGCPE